MKKFYIGAILRTITAHWVLIFMVLSGVVQVIRIVFTLFGVASTLFHVIQVSFILLAGLFGFFAAYRLSISRFRSSVSLGFNSIGNISLGIGLLAYGLLEIFETSLSREVYSVLLVLSMLFFVGLFIEYRSYKQQSYFG